MALQIHKLKSIFASDKPWQRLLYRYDELREIHSCISNSRKITAIPIQNKLLRIYKKHITEWEMFEKNFDWTQKNLFSGASSYEQLPFVMERS